MRAIPPGLPRADDTGAAMEIGDPVTYRGKRYVYRGIEPMSVDDRRVLLGDPVTGEIVLVPLSALRGAGFEEEPGS